MPCSICNSENYYKTSSRKIVCSLCFSFVHYECFLISLNIQKEDHIFNGLASSFFCSVCSSKKIFLTKLNQISDFLNGYKNYESSLKLFEDSNIEVTKSFFKDSYNTKHDQNSHENNKVNEFQNIPMIDHNEKSPSKKIKTVISTKSSPTKRIHSDSLRRIVISISNVFDHIRILAGTTPPACLVCGSKHSTEPKGLFINVNPKSELEKALLKHLDQVKQILGKGIVQENILPEVFNDSYSKEETASNPDISQRFTDSLNEVSLDEKYRELLKFLKLDKFHPRLSNDFLIVLSGYIYGVAKEFRRSFHEYMNSRFVHINCFVYYFDLRGAKDNFLSGSLFREFRISFEIEKMIKELFHSLNDKHHMSGDSNRAFEQEIPKFLLSNIVFDLRSFFDVKKIGVCSTCQVCKRGSTFCIRCPDCESVGHVNCLIKYFRHFIVLKSNNFNFGITCGAFFCRKLGSKIDSQIEVVKKLFEKSQDLIGKSFYGVIK